MTFEPVLLTLLTISAPIALTAALVRLIALFAAPYVDPAKSVENWRGPGLRVWLLLIPVFTLCIGGLAVYGLGQVLLNDGLHWSLRLASFFGLTMVASMGFGAIGLALKAQNRLVLDHALETRRPGETMPGIRSANLLEIGALFVFGAGFILISGFGIPDLRDASLLPFEEIQTRLRLLDCSLT